MYVKVGQQITEAHKKSTIAKASSAENDTEFNGAPHIYNNWQDLVQQAYCVTANKYNKV